MKKLYPLIILLFVGYGLFAQDVNLGDFEDQAASGWTSWDATAGLGVAANPESDAVNGSSYALKLTPTATWGSIARWINDGIFTEKPSKITVKVYSLAANNQIKINLDNGMTGEEYIKYEDFKSVPQNEWVKLQFDLSAVDNWDIFVQLAFQPEMNEIIYFDEIEIFYQSSEPVTGLIQDFESYTIGDQLHAIGWGGMVAEVADDPIATGNNVLKFTPNNYNSAPVLKFTLDEGKTLADYPTFKFKGFFAQGDVGWKDIYVVAYATQPTTQFQTGEAIGSINRASGASTSWENISIDIEGSSALTGDVYFAFGINCAATGDQGGTGVTTIWYSDDVRLIGETTNTNLVPETVSNIYSIDGMVCITNVAGANIQIFSATGAKMFEQTAAGSAVNVNLPKGLYIVVVNNKAAKVIVK